jgi:single-strand DNA-binding protein
VNVIALIGNVVAEPELRYTAAGKAVCSFRVAVNRPGSDAADFFQVVTWERQAEVASTHLAKGRRVGIEGRLHHSTWDAGEGRRSRVEIVAQRLDLLGRRTDSKETTESSVEEQPAEAVIA